MAQSSALNNSKAVQRPVPARPAGADGDEEIVPFRWLILVGLVTASILEVLDTTIVNVALPQMAGNLGATAQEIGWVSTGYILSNVIVLPMTAWLASRFGRRRYLVASIILFLVASMFCGTSRTLTELVFWRIIQGSGGAALLSTAQATIREIFPARQQGTVQSIYILGIIVAPTLGPTLGGWITDNYSWPWVFFVNLPIGMISLGLVASFLGDAKHKVTTTKVDWWGIGLLAVGLGSLQYVLEEGQQNDWFESSMIVRFCILSAICLTSFLIWELHPSNKQPVVNLRVMKNRDLTTAMTLFMVMGFGLYGGVFIFPLFVQNILGFTPTETGLVLMPGAIATGFATLFVGRLANIVNPRVIIVFGMAMFIYSMWSLGHLTTVSGEQDTQLALIFRGFGLGCLFTPINLAAFSSLKGVEIAQGSSLLNLMRQLGGSFGIAYLGTHLDQMDTQHSNALNAHLGLANPAFNQHMLVFEGALRSRGYDVVAAHQAALKILSSTSFTQAQMMSYNDAFLFIGMSMVIVSPLALLLRGAPGKPPAAAMEH